MAGYVDPAQHPFGRMIMCHLWADSEAELMAMVDTIGVARKWVQRPPKASWLHFDIAKGKRALAVKAGAIETDRYGPAEHVARLRGDNERLAQIERLRARRRGETNSETLFGIAREGDVFVDHIVPQHSSK